MPIQRIIALSFAGLALLIALAIWLRLVQLNTANELADVQSRRAEAMNVAESMRQKCRELTRFARAYVDTGDPRYLDFHQRIIAIRDGQRPRPNGYDPSFWDRVFLHGDASLTYRTSLSLDTIMRQSGVTESEAVHLRQAKAESDKLVAIERGVFADFDAKLKAAGGDYRRVNADAERQRLHDDAYMQQVARTMADVEDFIAAVDQDTGLDAQRLTAANQRLEQEQWIVIVLILTAGAAGLAGSHRLIVLPLRRLVDSTHVFAAGDYQQREAPGGTLELRHLGDAFNDMATAIEADIHKRMQLEAEAERIRAAAEASRKRLLNIADQAPGTVFEFARTAGSYAARFVSDGVLLITGVTRQRITERFGNFLDLIETQSREQLMASFELSATQGTSLSETLNIRHAQSGEVRWLQLNASPQRLEDGTTLWRGFFTDITEQKHLQAELSSARDAARAAEQAKAEFLANMSHEIRTPMNAIIGMTHLALRTQPSPRQHDYLKKIENAAGALLRIINDILDFSKIEAGKLSIETVEFSLRDVLDNVRTLIGQRAQDKGLELLFKIDPALPNDLVGDPVRIGQVLTNFCANAVKFSDHGEIIVSADVLERDRGVLLHLSVRDSGIGLSPEQQRGLFRPFEQADSSTTRKYGGTGLGLSISKQLVEMMGGEIGVSSEPGKGSRFWFTIRLAVPESLAPATPFEAESLAGKRLLVVDDNASAREILASLASSLKLDVTTAAGAAEAVSMVQQADIERPYDILLLDWKLPVTSGAQAARRIRQNAALQHQPRIIMVTAFGREEVLKDLDGLPIDGVLVKPIDTSTLLDALVTAYGRQAVTRVATAAAPAMSLPGLRVLLAEDNEVNQEVACEILGQAGIVVSVARNGREAIDCLQRDRYDLVLMDLQMPVLNGIAATLEIRRNPQFDALPVIAMTANVMASDIEECRRAGMQDHIIKPIDVNQMFATLRRWAPRHIASGEAAAASAIAAAQPLDGASPVRWPDRIDGIDVPAALVRVGGNRVLLHRLLIKFAAHHADAPQQIREALDGGDRELALRLVHTLKGVAGNVSAIAVEHAARDLESAMIRGEADIESHLAALRSPLSAALDAIGRLDASRGPDANAGIDHVSVASLAEKLAELQTRIDDYDTRAVELLDDIETLLRDAAGRALLRELEKHIAGYNFEAARQSLSALAQGLRVDLPVAAVINP